MVKRFGWRSLLLLATAACGAESVTAPGACPSYCVGTNVKASDTLMATAVSGDTSYQGYVQRFISAQLIATSPGVATTSRGILRFFRFADTISLNLGDTVR